MLGPATTTTPLDPHERAAEWRLAALVLALVAVSSVGEDRALVRPLSAPPTGPARRVLAAGRVARPPRSC